MHRFLIQTAAGHPCLDAGEAPPDLLGPQEAVQLQRLKVLKRRRDWLMGRWTAKHLVRQHLQEAAGVEYRLDEILILADHDGAPYAALRGSSVSREATTEHRLNLSLSISHSGDRSFCALTDEPAAAIGADIEVIEPREPELPQQFFTTAEVDLLAALPAASLDAGVTAIWSAKEAVLKALRTGLRSDTRWLTCLPAQIARLPVVWTACEVALDSRLLAQVNEDILRPAMQVSEAFWRVTDGYIAAYAVARPS